MFLLFMVPLIILGVSGNMKAKTILDDSGLIRLENSVEMTLEMIQMLNDQVNTGSLSVNEAQEKVLSAILGEQNENGIRMIKENINLGENGYIYILDQNGIVIASAESAQGENFWDAEDSNGDLYIQEVISQANQGGGVTYYDWPAIHSSQTERKINYSKTDPHWDWVVSASTYLTDFNAPAKSLLLFIIMIMVISITIGSGVVWIVATQMTKPIAIVTKQMHSLAHGHLNIDDITVKTNDETGKLAISLNQMKQQWNKIMTRLATATSTVSSQSEELSQAADEVMAGAEQITCTMDDLATGAEVEADHISRLSFIMDRYSDKVRATNENSEQIQIISNEVQTLTNQGSEYMESSTVQMNKIDQIVQEAVMKVEGLDKYSQQISELVSVIHDIAEQTNLLSLNAQIEAARAGESGQGFAVVADEVKKLAEQSTNSVSTITEIVHTIQNESGNVVSSLQTGYVEVKQGTEQIHLTQQTFKEIRSSIHEMVKQIQIVADNFADMKNNSLEINDSIQEIAARSEQSAAGIEQTSASIEQTSSSMQEITASASELAKLAEDLMDLVNQFKR